ncbi:hypothetical protein [Pseudomonas sp. NPDC007930]|uniref:hypothetical protein n=1 Tax=Pseudomonas sp. NPDC007930 TaxID=3364417 RepID=UPI0036E53FFF
MKHFTVAIAFVGAVFAAQGAFAVPHGAEVKAQAVNVAHSARPASKTVQVAENRSEFGSRYQRY